MNLNTSENKEFKKTLKRALYLIEYRDHSRKELINKLKRTTNEETAILVADKMEELDLINDNIYAKQYAKKLVNKKHFFGSRLKHEMTKKGLNKNLIEEVIEEMNLDPIIKIAELIHQKYSKNFFDEKNKRRTIIALQRLGYKWDDIKISINEYLSNEEQII